MIGVGSSNSNNNEAPKLESAVQSNSSTCPTQPVQNVLTTREVGLKSLKRPVLPSKDYEPLLVEETVNQPSETLYDYTTLDAW